MNGIMMRRIIWWICGILLTAAAGIYNFEFWGGSTSAATSNIAVSVLTYGFWLVTTIRLVWQSKARVQTCIKISIVLIMCLAIGLFAAVNPLTVMFLSSIMGIPMALMHHVDLHLMAALLYLSVIAMDWLCVMVKYITDKNRGCFR